TDPEGDDDRIRLAGAGADPQGGGGFRGRTDRERRVAYLAACQGDVGDPAFGAIAGTDGVPRVSIGVDRGAGDLHGGPVPQGDDHRVRESRAAPEPCGGIREDIRADRVRRGLGPGVACCRDEGYCCGSGGSEKECSTVESTRTVHEILHPAVPLSDCVDAGRDMYRFLFPHTRLLMCAFTTVNVGARAASDFGPLIYVLPVSRRNPCPFVGIYCSIRAAVKRGRFM